jgi:hypothetical protein
MAVGEEALIRESIKNHLRPYAICGRRVTSINHAFASATAINLDKPL